MEISTTLSCLPPRYCIHSVHTPFIMLLSGHVPQLITKCYLYETTSMFTVFNSSFLTVAFVHFACVFFHFSGRYKLFG